jgi:hypothetical protein
VTARPRLARLNIQARKRNPVNAGRVVAASKFWNFWRVRSAVEPPIEGSRISKSDDEDDGKNKDVERAEVVENEQLVKRLGSPYAEYKEQQ